MATVTIGSGATTSAAIDLTVFQDEGRPRVDGIVLPSNWTAGSISFLSSFDLGNTYQPVYLPDGALYSVSAGAGDYVPLDFGVFAPLSNIKIVSSVVQTSNVILNLIVVDASKAVSLGGELGAGSGAAVSSTGTWLSDVSLGAKASNVSKANPGNLFAFDATNSSGSLVYLQFFNSTSAPTSGATALYSYAIPAAGSVLQPSDILKDAQFFGPLGSYFSAGIAWGLSGTLATYTASGAYSSCTVQVQYV
jgi:hypothetical protein